MKRTTYSRRKDAVVKAAPARPLSPPPAKKTAPSRASGFGALFRRREDKPPARSTAPPLRGLVEDDGDDQDEDDGGDDEDYEMGSTSSAPRRRYAQSYLDDGVLERCNLCQMRYSRGVAEDESLHRRHCKRFRLGVKWPSGEGDMLRSFPDGSRLVVTTHMTAAVRDALEVVDTELGFADCEEGAPGDHLPQTVYVVVSDARRVVGVAVVVPIERGFRVIASPADNGDGDGDGDHNVMASRDAERAAVGVSRIWVHRDHRRHGIGSRLLEAVHSHTGVPDRQLLALSQPTAMGAALARKWFGRSDFLLMK